MTDGITPLKRAQADYDHRMGVLLATRKWMIEVAKRDFIDDRNQARVRLNAIRRQHGLEPLEFKD